MWILSHSCQRKKLFKKRCKTNFITTDNTITFPKTKLFLGLPNSVCVWIAVWIQWIFQIVYDTFALFWIFSYSILLQTTILYVHLSHFLSCVQFWSQSEHERKNLERQLKSLLSWCHFSYNAKPTKKCKLLYAYLVCQKKKKLCVCVTKCNAYHNNSCSLVEWNSKLTIQKSTEKKLDTKMSTVIACFISTTYKCHTSTLSQKKK